MKICCYCLGIVLVVLVFFMVIGVFKGVIVLVSLVMVIEFIVLIIGNKDNV